MYFNDSHCFNYEDPQSDGPAFVAENIWPFGAKWPPLLFQCASLETASYPQRLCAGAWISEQSFLFETRPMETTLRFRCCDGPCSTTNHIFISNDRMHTAAKLPDRNLRSRLFRCCISGCFFNLHIMRAKAFMNTRLTYQRCNTIAKKTVIIYCSGLALSPILHQLSLLFIPGSSGTVVKWICYGAVFFFPWEFLLPYTPGVFRNVSGWNETAVSLKE